MSIEYVNANAKLISIHGKIIVLQQKTRSRNNSPVIGAFDNFRAGNEISKADNMAPFVRRPLILVQYTKGEFSDILYDMLKSQADYYAVGVSHVPGVGEIYSAIYHNPKPQIRIRLDAKLFDIVECVVPIVKGKAVDQSHGSRCRRTSLPTSRCSRQRNTTGVLL